MSEEPAFSTILEEIHQAHVSSSDSDDGLESNGSARVKLAWQARRHHAGRNSRMVKVLGYEKLILVLALVLFPLGHHFRGRREFSIAWLGRSIDTVMGVCFLRFIATMGPVV